ncbi:hypothetical protein YSA_08101 [Pseudomonas putida ND6]|uniref:Uncharacterized protein n=1 Tax=Pseudomonas putida ND6 TaxID=231023 RepID=I3V081_PSEPU|nr:hypothetical protein YSA_08101 [Pseudomonas putida ND6]
MPDFAGDGFQQVLRCWLLRGHARSHSYRTGFEINETPVGVGSPAKKPAQANRYQA